MAGLKIITADERLATPARTNLVILGASGKGKTTLARTLDPKTTLFLDGEAGTLALGEWAGRSIDLRKSAQAIGCHAWELARGIACLLSGPDPSDPAGPYSLAMHTGYVAGLGDPAELFDGIETVFVDSITVASRWAFSWAQTQPEAFSEKTGKPDNRGAYGLLGREMVRWLTVLQHAPFSIVVVGILDQAKDDLGRQSYFAQIDGSAAARALPGIFDNVVTLSTFDKADDGSVTHNMESGTNRALVCGLNPWGLPGKDRSGRLDTLEPPDLGKLVAKMRTGARRDAALTTKTTTETHTI